MHKPALKYRTLVIGCERPKEWIIEAGGLQATITWRAIGGFGGRVDVQQLLIVQEIDV